jgi:Na+/melibiose symporter-like transporter
MSEAETIKPQIKPSDNNKTLLSWEANIRPYKQHSKAFYKNLGSILFLLCVILLFIKHFPLIVLVIAVYFFVYILDTVKPQKTIHKITEKGIFTLDKLYLWDQLGTFWFEKKGKNKIFYVQNFLGLPPRLMMILGEHDEQKITQTLKDRLTFQKPEPSPIEKASLWLSQKLDLESEHPHLKSSKK